MGRVFDCLIYKDKNEYRILMIEQSLSTNMWHRAGVIPSSSSEIHDWKKGLQEAFDTFFFETDEFVSQNQFIKREDVLSTIAARIIS